MNCLNNIMDSFTGKGVLTVRSINNFRVLLAVDNIEVNDYCNIICQLKLNFRNKVHEPLTITEFHGFCF